MKIENKTFVKRGGFRRRFLAQIIDMGVFFTGLWLGNKLLFDIFTLNTFALLAYVYLYFVWLVAKKGATPGKMLLDLYITDNEGHLLSQKKALVRFLGKMVSGFFFGFGYLAMIWDPEKKGWHDMMAGSRVDVMK